MSAPKPSTVAAAATTSYARAHAPSMHDVLDMPVSAALEAVSACPHSLRCVGVLLVRLTPRVCPVPPSSRPRRTPAPRQSSRLRWA